MAVPRNRMSNARKTQSVRIMRKNRKACQFA